MWSCIEPVFDEISAVLFAIKHFCWFLIIISGFILRLDHLGASSFIRWLFGPCMASTAGRLWLAF
jgi:hypothetical protein